MPGMMDTILNLGLNDKTTTGSLKKNFKQKICKKIVIEDLFKCMEML